MIIFHEGMPRSGKSYAATVDHIIPALKKGREVWARIDGLDPERIAEAGDLDLDQVRGLLHELTEEQVREIWKQPIPKDALIVIDELQNYWPQGRASLGPEITKWIAEHGHHGWDVLTMGQLLKDCHRQWINRTNRKVQFIKKDMLGKDDQYKWVMYVGKPDRDGKVRFDEVSKGDGTYNPRYFGCYKSHSEGTENTATYADERVVIWKSPIFRKWLPILAVSTLVAVGYIINLFSGGLAPKPQPKPVAVVTTMTGPDGKVKVKKEGAIAESEQPEPKAKEQDDEWPDLLADLAKENRIRVAAGIRTAAHQKVVIEWRDKSMQIVESLTTDQLKALGWGIMISDGMDMVALSKGGKRYIATAWPVPQPMAKNTDDQERKIRDESRNFAPGLVSAPGQQGGGSGGGFHPNPLTNGPPDLPPAI